MKFNIFFIFIGTFSLFSNTIPAQDYQENAQEQTYLSTSQWYYLSGDNLRYVVYLFDPATGRKEVPSSILLTELLDPAGRLIFHHIHSMDQGSSPGSYSLPDTLKTGCYWLRAYTRYQVGYTENLIHYLPVYIIHPDDVADPQALNEMMNKMENMASSPTNTGHNQAPPVSSRPSGKNIKVELLQSEKDPTIRETVNLTVKITDQNGKPVTTHFTFLVRDHHQFDADLFWPQSLPDYRSLRGNPFSYQVGDGVAANEKRPNAEVSQEERTAQPEYLPQNELKLLGRYIDPETMDKLSFRAISLTQIGQNPEFTLLFTDRDGKFEFNQLNFTNKENQLILNAGINKGIIIEDESVRPSFSPPILRGSLIQSASFRQFLTMRARDLQYRKFYSPAKSFEENPSGEGDISRYRIYPKADRTYDLDNYIELIDMEEVIIELLPNVKIFRENDQTRIKIFYHGNEDILPDPLFLINGRIVKDNDFVLSLDNRNINKIEVLFKESSLEPFGPVGIGGVVAIYTKTPVEIPYGIPVDFMGYHQPDERIVQFSPRETESDHFPDFNPLLYWDPEGITNGEGIGKFSFYTNDLVSDFEVIVEGITPDGEAFYHVGQLSVTKPQHP